jgi:antitoxin YefM
MVEVNFKTFRSNLKASLNKVEEENETMLIKRPKKEGVVLLPLSEYNGIMETLHLLSSRKNAMNLYESIEQMKAGKEEERNLLDL